MGTRVVLSLDGAILTEVELAKPVTVVGRHPTCDICIDHPAISARHVLFRIVNRTVYVEDLASTNGTKVNGLLTSHQVVHHLDMIEVGRHKLHFFDDSLLVGGVDSLETTVHTDFERTMLAAHVPESRAPAAPASRRGDDDLSRTMAISREAVLRQGPVHEIVRTGDPAPDEVLMLRVASGPRTGEMITLDQANTLLGTVGADTALVVRRGTGFFLARFGGQRPPRLNARELGPGAHRLAPNDLIEVGDMRFEVLSVAAGLLVTVAATLNERLALTAEELARSQVLLREASAELMTAFRGAADRIVEAQRDEEAQPSAKAPDYAVVLDHLYRAVQHLQSHDLVNQLIDAQKLRVDKMREKLSEAMTLGGSPVADPARAEQWIERSREMLDCIVDGIRQIDEDARQPAASKKQAGSVDLF